jgi:hypothetical protein
VVSARTRIILRNSHPNRQLRQIPRQKIPI